MRKYIIGMIAERVLTSEPAKSTRVNLPMVWEPLLLLVSLMTSEQMRWERLLSAFICVEAVVRLADPRIIVVS